MHIVARNLLALAAAGLLSTACASTHLVNAWREPGYGGPLLTRIMVIGVTKQSAVRRIFEDVFVQQLRAQSVAAIPSYMLIPEDGEVPKERLAQAVQESGADGLLITRLVRVDRQVQIYPGYYFGPPYMGFYGFYSSAWVGYYEAPQAYTYDIVTSETSLFEAKSNRLLWSGTTETFSPRDVNKDTRELAAIIIKALGDQGLIPKKQHT
jgi:hypothetical protein